MNIEKYKHIEQTWNKQMLIFFQKRDKYILTKSDKICCAAISTVIRSRGKKKLTFNKILNSHYENSNQIIKNWMNKLRTIIENELLEKENE